MSTPQTDAYWQNQQSIVESYATMVNSMKNPALHQALQTICADAEIHERTKDQCRAIYNTWLDAQGDEWADVSMSEENDPNIQYQQSVLDKDRDESDRAESHNAPSEGFDRL